MDEPFELPVTFKGEELLFPAQLLNYGYIHKFRVGVYGQEIFFEQDEEGLYRAIVDPTQLESKHGIPPDLLEAIADSIITILK